MSEILKIVSDRILIKKQSDHLMAKCPFHSDYIGTLHIDTWNNQAYCPVCNRAWTPTLFISEFDKKPIYEAYSQIAPITIENNEWQKPYKEIKAQVELYKSNYK